MAEQPFTVPDLDVEDDAFFDTDTLVVDGTNNRVGILVAAPTVTFDVLGTSLMTGTLNVTSNLTLGTGGTAYIFPTTDGGSGEALVSDGGGNLSFTAVGPGSVTSVGITAGTGISVSGSPITSSGSMTVTNIGVTSLVAGSNIAVSAATGAVTISSTDQFVGTVTSVATSSGTFVDITGGTITTSGTITSDLSASGTAGATTFLRGDNTWSTPSGTYSSWTLSGDSGSNQTINDGDTVDIAGGTGIATVASATDTITVTNTGVTSNVAGTGISVSGATGAVTITNSGVTSIVAGTNISISGATGAVTINSTDQYDGTVTSVGSGTGLSGGPITTSGTLNLDLDSLSASGTLVGTDDLAVVDGTTTAKTQISTIPLSIFNNDSGWTSNTGTVTSVATSSGTFVNVTGGTITGSGTITGDLSATGTASGSTFLRGDNTWSAVPGGYTSWSLTGDAGTTEAVTDGNTVDIAGGTGITTTASATDTLTVDLDNTAVSAGSYTYSSFTVDAQGRLTAASSGSSPGTMSDWTLAGDAGTPQTISDGNTATFTAGSGISTSAGTTDTLTITNTGVTSNVAGTGISVSGATGAVTITNSGVTSIVAGTNVSISGATGAVTINSTDQYDGTVTSVATSNGTFVDVSGGTITATGTITADLSATGTASASTYLRGDNSWATIAGDITEVTAGTGLEGGGTSGAVTLSVDYTGTDNFIDVATDLEGTPIAAADSIVYHDTGDNNVKKGLVSDLPFSSTSGTVTSVAASGGTGISISGSPITTSGTITIGNTGVTSNVAGTGISVSGATGAVTITNAGVTGVTGGEGIDTTGSTGSITLTLDLDELTTTTTSSNADFFPIVNSGAAQFKIAPSDIDLSTFNNDSGWTTNAGTVTSVATSNGTFVNVTGGTITGSGTITGDLSATGTASASTYLRGDNTWAAVPGGYTDWTLAGDSGANQTISDGNTATIAGGTALSTVGSATDTLTINLDNTAVSAGSYTYGSFTVDAQGRLTAASSGSSPGTMSSFSLTGDTGTPQTISDGDTVDIAGGTGLSSVAAATDTVTLSLDNTAVSAGSYTYSSITVDAQGRLTSASSGSAPGTMSSFALDGDSGSTQTISDGDTMDIAGGTGISTVASATDTVTITNTGVTSAVASTGISVSGATGAVTFTNTGVTSIVAGSNISISGATGAVTISSTDQFTGTVTSVATSSGTFVDVTGGTFTTSGTITGDLSATGTASATTFLRGDNTWSTPTGDFSNFIISDGSTTQTIADGDTLLFSTGTGVTAVVSATDTLTITNTGVTSNVAGSGIGVSGATGAVTITNSGVTSIVAGTNVSISGATGAVTISSTDQYTGTVTSVATSSGTFVDVTGGTITASGTITGDLSATGTASASTFLRGDNTWASPAGSFTFDVGGSSGPDQTISSGDKLTIAQGTGITSIASATDTVTVTLADTAVTPGSYTYSSITVDQQGRLTSASSGSSPGTMDDFTLAGSSGPSQTISDGNTLTIAQGTGITSVASTTDTVTITNTGVTSNVAGTGISVSGATGAVTISNTGVTSIVAGTNISVSGATGAVTINSTDQFVGTVTSVATSSGTFVDITGGTITTAGTITSDLSATGTASASTFLRGDNTWATPDTYAPTNASYVVIGTNPSLSNERVITAGTGISLTDGGANGNITIAATGGSYTSWTLAGDSGSSQTISDGNTATVAGGTGLSSIASATDTVTLNLDNTAVSAGSYTYASLTVDAQGRLTAASSGSAPGTMDDWILTGDSGTQTITDGNTVLIDGGTGISTAASATDTLTVTNTGVTSNVAGTGISVSGATGAVTITNSGVTSIVAGTNVSISGATGAVTINSTDQYVGTVTSVATSSGTFVDITGGTFTTSGTITGDLSATGTASASTFLRGDNTWATPTGSVGGSNTEILYNDSGAQDGIPIFTYINTATSEEVILEGTSDQPLMRITQLGTGDALLIEDSTNPDATPFKVNGDGNVAIGGASYGNKLQVHGDVGFTTTDFYIGGASGQFKALQGTAALPYYTTNGDTNTGMYNAAADTLGFSTAGVNAFQFGPSGQFGIGGATYGTAGQVLSSGGASAVPTWEDASTGTVTSVATSSGTFVDVSGGTITTTGTITGDLSATGTASASTFLRGDNTWATPAGGGTMSSWILAGDSGTQTISDGNTATVAGGTGLTSVAAATDTVTLNLDNTAVSAGSYTYSSITVDAQGRLTAASSGSSPGTMSSFTLAGSSGVSQTISDGNTLTIAQGTGITSVASATDTVTITNTGVTSNVAGSGISVSGATGAVTIANTGVTSIVAGTNVSISGATGAVTINSTDQYAGTVTSVATSSGTFVDITGGTITTSGTITGDLSATGTASGSTFLRGDNTWATPSGGGTMSSFTLAGDSGSSQTISDGDTLDIAGGTGISTVAGATDTVTVTNTGVTSNVAGTGISVSGATGAVTITNAGVTSAVAGTGIDVSGATGAVTITTDVSDFMTNGVNNRVLTATGTDAMNAEANMTFDGSTLDVLGAGRTYEGSTTIFAVATTTNLTAANDAGKYLIKTHTGVHTFNLPAASSVGEHYTIVYGPAATTTSGAVTIDAAAGDNITWYDGSASVYGNTITWTPKAGSAITIICSSASSAWVAIGTDQ